MEDLARRASSPSEFQNRPFIVRRADDVVEDLEKLLPAPLRIKRAIKLISLESFTEYVNRFKNKDTEVQLKRNGGAVALIDAPAPDQPHWAEHSAEFVVTYSEHWNRWDSRAKQGAMNQKTFAEFVEDNYADFVAPKGADMLDIAKTLHVEQNSKFLSAIRLESGDVHFDYEKTTQAKVGQRDELDVPSQFTIQIPILESEEPRQIEVRLRYDLTEGRLTFSIEILRRTVLLEEVRRSIEATITNETKIKPFLVAG